MASKGQKEAWIDKVMSSTQRMVPAQPPANLFERIRTGLDSPVKVKVISLYVKQWTAAAILLLALNVGSVVYFTKQDKNYETANTNGLVAEMQLDSTYNY